jgi:hypothetical protein
MKKKLTLFIFNNSFLVYFAFFKKIKIKQFFFIELN